MPIPFNLASHSLYNPHEILTNVDQREERHTRRQTLLQLIRLIRILQYQGVQEAMASDLELDLLGFAIAFYACSCLLSVPLCLPFFLLSCSLPGLHGTV